MKKNKSLIEEAKTIFAENGKNSYETAKEAMLKEKVEYGPLREAITYFMEEIWKNYEHPALLSLTCEAVGEKPKNLTTIGAALVLLTGAADIHDDIIDRSKRKGSKPTLFGKYGTDTALLVGDALLVKGLTLLSQATQDFPEKQRDTIVTTVKDAFFEIGNAEAEETSYRGKWDADAEKLLSIMEKKAGIAAATAKLGAFIGGGSTEQVKALSEYGRTLAVLANVRNEFVDVYEPDELRHRTRNECLPLPLLYA
ncbi:MAG: polyprenyl synthetase family protein, partial [Candidatus Bathyarchaeia archaeon]